ncbi:bifunctional 2-polyprenyl-6-hydroxyphenol methylase/3-demethylubiquinol 3-O-methyltransferase UbiG [Erythrobacter sp. LQ02-29]|uniref:bifunctional 2-polyprenyl-6-hydroxyphenol methylase/3-demethylubiquinol 3-O-methyltransferase UbiG n=1 Tax=Erythrobacter sp. LQ02-29 TaxID=2920384 RepID=UPI001F4E62B7|nr:bifunctional 2-polyprenyl-6-hydroxyphenol methylase/3-demethylubiquinol 3-O-methyltransferase UbiG [Erythrobacter sp. LQ02-29]MCP9221493.1 bifunctional 2-polyprenyl-6-hydroxyphenol methylase/3-demethylubiquinol 3-O-methyltransferase UbiG [Erythrobacter sp. LQ02-29]
MGDATSAANSKSSDGATIRASEAAHFGRLAADWWDPRGSSAMLHRLNPVRLEFVRAAIDRHWAKDVAGFHPLAGKRALDVGCGAGLLAEPLARLGAEVTGVDAAAENIAVARDHAAKAGFDIAYHAGELGELELGTFDLVTCMEVIEHVASKPALIAALRLALADEGLLILSTPNRTPQSKLLLVEGAELTGLIPRGTHHWDDFVTPQELTDLLTAAGLEVTETRGIAWRPDKGLHLSDDSSLNYILAARRA